MKQLVRLLLAALVFGVAGAAGALPLSVLVDDPKATIVVGDKQFSDFSYSFTGNMPGAEGIEVLSLTEPDGDFGLRFQGAFLDLASSPGGSDALISFTVTVLDKGQSITGASLGGNPTLLGCFGTISVVETFDVDPELRLVIFADEEAGQQSTDSISFASPLQTLRVTKDILAFAVKGAPTLSFIDQTFSQKSVPEPATLLMLGIAFTGLGYAGRRRA